MAPIDNFRLFAEGRSKQVLMMVDNLNRPSLVSGRRLRRPYDHAPIKLSASIRSPDPPLGGTIEVRHRKTAILLQPKIHVDERNGEGGRPPP